MKRYQFVFFIMMLSLLGCLEDKETGGIYIDVNTESPYDEPVWHPSGEIIGFNYTPVKEIHSYDGRQYHWSFDHDSTGFWLVNVDGSDVRRILPYRLNTPAWSPDGKWISFSNGAQISIMPFDGENLDTAKTITFDFPGRNFFPTWNANGKKLTYNQSVCNEIPCGIWLYDIEKGSSELLSQYGMWSCWHPRDDSLIYLKNNLKDGKDIGDYVYLYDFSKKASILLCTIESPNTNNRNLQYSPDGNFIAFISILNNSEGSQLFKITSEDLEVTKLTSSGCTQFSWSPDSEKIVYVHFYDTYIDETTGSLWIMDADGGNKMPLTYNRNLKMAR